MRVIDDTMEMKVSKEMINECPFDAKKMAYLFHIVTLLLENRCYVWIVCKHILAYLRDDIYDLRL